VSDPSFLDQPAPSPEPIPAPEPPMPTRELVPLAADEVMRDGIALGVNPVTEGRLIEASAKTGLPREVLREHTDYQVADIMQADARVRAYRRDLDLAAWVAANPGYADISRDDELNLFRVKNATDEWLERVAYSPTTGAKWARPVREVGRGIAGGVVGLGRAGLGVLAFGADTVQESINANANVLGGFGSFGTLDLIGADVFGEMGTFFRDMSEHADVDRIKAAIQDRSLGDVQKEAAALRRSTVSVLGVSPGDVAGGFTSLAPTLVAGAASGGAMWAVLGAAGLQSAGGMYADLREDDASYGSAAAKAALAGSITAALTKVFPTAEQALAGMMRSAPNKVAAARTAFAKVLGKRAAGEMGEEALDEFAQSLIRGDSLAEAMDAAVKAGLIGGIIGGTVGIGEARMAHREARVEGALSFHQSVDGLVQALDSSKTMERSPEVMKAYLQTIRPEIKNAPAVFAAEDLQLIMNDPKVAEDLTKAGITAEAVAAAAAGGGVIRTTQDRVLIDLPAETREKVRPLMRESADGMSLPEAELAKEELAAGKDAGVDEATKKTLKLITKERARLVKELQTAHGMAMTREDAKKVVDVAVKNAFTLATRNGGAAEGALASLQKIVFTNKENLTPAEVRHRITRLAGKDGKTALHGIRLAQNLGAVAGRVDLLTGQITINPDALVDQRQVDALLARARSKALNLEGRSVKVQTEAGDAEVDAGAVVGTIRERTEKMNRLRECLG
jgi:hypothetical protein